MMRALFWIVAGAVVLLALWFIFIAVVGPID